MIRLTDEMCVRCDNHLASHNHSRDRLCGACQRDLGRTTSTAYRAWVADGRRRVVTRVQPTAVPPSNPVSPAARTTAELLATVQQASAELARRRQEAEALLRAMGVLPPKRRRQHT